jgi:hypothetical protein
MVAKYYSIRHSVQIFLCIVLMCANCCAQDTISLDFKTKRFTNTHVFDNIQEGDFYQLKITNINTNLYKVSIQTNDTTIEHQLAFPEFGLLKFDSIQALLSNLTSLSTELPTISKAWSSTSMTASTPQQTTKPTKIKEDARIKKIKQAIQDERTLLQSKSDTMEIVKIRLDSLSLAVKKYILFTSLSEDRDTTFGEKYSIAKLFQKLDSLQSLLIQEKKNVLNTFTLYLNSFDQSIVDSSIEIKNAYNAATAINSQLNTKIDTILTMIETVQSEDMIRKMIMLENTKSHEYVSFPFQLKGNKAKLHLMIEPRDKESVLSTYTVDYVLPSKTSWFAGVGSSFYISTLTDDAYSTTTVVSTDTTYKIIQEQPGSIEIGLQAMMIIGFCHSNTGYWYGSFGPALSITKTIKPRFLLGAGYAFGKRNLFTVGLNAVIGSVDRLSEGYDVNKSYGQPPTQITVSRTEIGLSLTVGYVFNL